MLARDDTRVQPIFRRIRKILDQQTAIAGLAARSVRTYPPAMRTALAALAFVVAAGGAQAAGKVSVTVSELLAEPKGHRSETVVVRGIRCVDPGPGGFICEAAASGQRLRLDASGLGGGTTDAIAEKLIGPCNGFAALAKLTCTFDVTFTPTGSGFENGVTIINTPEIDISVPRRR